jgi:peptidoglycan/LPS O-acetylase OafA/YrhL
MSVLVKFNADKSTPIAIESSRKPNLVSPSSKLLGLEILRFTSALAVLFYHYNHFMQIPGTAAVAWPDVPFYNWLWPLYDHGNLGVELFWGISGYIFFWIYGQAIHAGAVSATRFFWLRFSRLYPLHFATLIAVAGLQIFHRQLAGAD